MPTSTPSSSASAMPVALSLYPCSSAAPAAPRPTVDQLETYRAVIQTANTEPVSSHACDPLTMILPATECCAPAPKDEVLADWGRRIYDPAMNWEFNVDPALLAAWRAGSYAQFVPEGALIATNPDGRMASMLFDGDLVTLVFVGWQDLMIG